MQFKKQNMYPEEMVKPMRAELSDAGFQDLYSAEAVEQAISKTGTTLVVVNSVCGCAARNARPGAKMSLENVKKPSNLVTVFAGVDKEAVDKVREHMFPFPPSSLSSPSDSVLSSPYFSYSAGRCVVLSGCGVV